MTFADEGIAEEMGRRGYPCTSRPTGATGKATTYRVDGLGGGTRGRPGPLLALGIKGAKHIPDVYLRASVRQRLDLLRGLMDTDGHAAGGNNSSCEFCVTSERLARGVRELLVSLGYSVRMKVSDAKLYGRVISER